MRNGKMENPFNHNPQFEYQYCYQAYAPCFELGKMWWGEFKTFEEAFIFLKNLNIDNLINWNNNKPSIFHSNMYGTDTDSIQIEKEQLI